MIQALISRYKRMRTEHYLRQTYQYQYAFVGMGQHSLTNLYPVLHYLGVPLKYICVTSELKAKLIERKYPSVKSTTSLDEILKDEAIKGVFVSASPSAHFSIASQVLQSGKSLFIEKPPCQTLEELDTLIALQQQYGSPVAMVGLQKRYAPAVRLLKKCLRKEHLINYDLHYLTGAYPERQRVGDGNREALVTDRDARTSGMGNALLDLYIHPLDLVCHLFGKPKIIAIQQVAKDSYLLMLQHPHIIGTLELSTSYTWTSAEETLKVCTRSGVYTLSQMEDLAFSPTSPAVFGIPMEKLRPRHETKECHLHRNNFTPILANNHVYTQGYYSEIDAFVNVVESCNNTTAMEIKTVRDTYHLMNEIQTCKNK